MAIENLDQSDFKAVLRANLSPSTAIKSTQFLKGRDKDLDDIQRTIASKGRHVFIHGFRGVGKTSLAQTAAFLHQSSDEDPILLTCGDGGSFYQIVHDMVSRGLGSDPRLKKSENFRKLKAGLGNFSIELRKNIEIGKIPLPTSMNEAVELTKLLSETHSDEPIVLLDEFESLADSQDRKRFADYIKQVSDTGIEIKFIFCGIGESLGDLLQSHSSTFRYFTAIKLGRLGFEPCMAIVEEATKALRLQIQKDFSLRIARISDGFPHFVHLICEHMLWSVFQDENTITRIKMDHYREGTTRALENIEPHLEGLYKKATQKYSNDYESILWAVADTHELLRRSADIYASYQRVMQSLKSDPMPREKFNGYMNRLKDKRHGNILGGSRQGWYEFTEKMMRGYARLRAESQGVQLDTEHPLEDRDEEIVRESSRLGYDDERSSLGRRHTGWEKR
jgi:Cdc6-like AAA superfamily ATPase